NRDPFPVVPGDPGQSPGILGKTRAAVTGSGTEEFRSNPRVQTHSFGHHLHISAAASQRSAISLIKVTFVAKKALLAYLINSADSRLVKTKAVSSRSA